MKKSKVRTRKVTLVIPESTYQLFKQATALANQATITTSKSLQKISDTMREALVKGLTTWKRLNHEATERAKEEIKQVSKAK